MIIHFIISALFLIASIAFFMGGYDIYKDKELFEADVINFSRNEQIVGSVWSDHKGTYDFEIIDKKHFKLK